MALGATPQAAAACQSGLCLPAQLARRVLGDAAPVAPALLVPSDGQAVPRSCRTALPLTLGAQPLMVRACSSTACLSLRSCVKFGMTHAQSNGKRRVSASSTHLVAYVRPISNACKIS